MSKFVSAARLLFLAGKILLACANNIRVCARTGGGHTLRSRGPSYLAVCRRPGLDLKVHCVCIHPALCMTQVAVSPEVLRHASLKGGLYGFQPPVPALPCTMSMQLHFPDWMYAPVMTNHEYVNSVCASKKHVLGTSHSCWYCTQSLHALFAGQAACSQQGACSFLPARIPFNVREITFIVRSSVGECM